MWAVCSHPIFSTWFSFPFCSPASAGYGVVYQVLPNPDWRSAVSEWFKYAIAAALLYGLHQVFTKMAADKIGEGIGGLVVECTAAVSIAIYVLALWAMGKQQVASAGGVWYSVLTGICVGLGTIAFFLLFQKGGPLSVVPGILAAGMALMAIASFTIFREPLSMTRLLGVLFSVLGLVLLRK
jgi:bacterial/archaeal transporter family protein